MIRTIALSILILGLASFTSISQVRTGPGKLADMILLDANPLDDIHNTQRIRAVIVGGKLMNRFALDKLLALGETMAKQS